MWFGCEGTGCTVNPFPAVATPAESAIQSISSHISARSSGLSFRFIGASPKTEERLAWQFFFLLKSLSPINGYHVEALLGGGSYGMVVKVIKAGRYYAMKVCSQQYLRQIRQPPCAAADLCRREAEVLKCIRHPEIPGYVDFFQYEGLFCLVEEYMPGDTLAMAISSDYRYQEEEVREIILKLLLILEFLHTPTAGKPAVIHRDLRLSNLIMIDGRLVLIDFGLAYRIQNCSDMELLVQCQMARTDVDDSLSYVENRNGFSLQSDLFGAGVVAVDLFTNSAIGDEGTSWEQKIPVSRPFILYIRKLLGVEGVFASCSEAMKYLRSI
ncbi:protein kinase domain-containing protein [Methylomusa anaerophila]|uniref:protein kinase domain-containing protein n=1 Tax=Methylomusa anaerophila TaxID=1930071 RepID=UPI001E6118A2|nr:protein kinase [Methylomusa anaerophila]